MAAIKPTKEANIEGQRYAEIGGGGNWYVFNSGSVGAAVPTTSPHYHTLQNARTPK